MTKKLFLFNFLLFSLCFSLNAQTATPSKETQKTDAAEIRRQSFEKVWTTVNEKHYDPTFGGVNWKKVRVDYEPKALAAKSERDFNQVLNQMLGELKLSHFGVYQPTAVIENNKISAGVVGIELKWIDNQAVISRIETASTAKLANLKTGFVIEKIGGKTVGVRKYC